MVGSPALVELVAEGNDELMQEFFDKGTIPDDHLVAGLRSAIVEHKIFPVLYTSGLEMKDFELPITLDKGVVTTLYANKPKNERAPKPAQINGGTVSFGNAYSLAGTSLLPVARHRSSLDPVH